MVSDFYIHRQRQKPQGYCKACARQTARAYGLSHPVEHRLSSSKWYANLSDDALKKTLRRFNEWRHNNRDRARELGTRWRLANSDKSKASCKKWADSNPDIVTARTQRHRARLVSAGGTFTPKHWKLVKALYKHVCLRCGRHDSDVKLTPDHVVPLAKGGSNNFTNIQPLCRSCNCGKRDRIADYRSYFLAT